MVEQLDNKNEVLFKTWTVPEQENVKTIIIQQPAETHMELNASTDKTAISSFGLSVVIALILAGLATWYAYWCAKKSFRLTKMSFDTVVAQIKASEISALDLNTKLFEQQKFLQDNELRFSYKVSELDKLRTLISEYLTCLISFNTEITLKLYILDDFERIEKAAKFNLRIANYHQLIELFLDCQNNDEHMKIRNHLKELLKALWAIREVIDKDTNTIKLKISYFSTEMQFVKDILNEYLASEIRKIKGE